MKDIPDSGERGLPFPPKGESEHQKGGLNVQPEQAADSRARACTRTGQHERWKKL